MRGGDLMQNSKAEFTREEILRRIETFFGSTPEGIAKAKLWYESANPMLGGITPSEMVDLGRSGYLMRWIDSQLGS